MKNLLLSILFCSALGSSLPALAQTASMAPVEYSERVAAEGQGQQVLYQRALAWSENHFAYGPKTDVRADADAGALRLRGMGKAKIVTTAGKETELPVRFEFVFRATDNGYAYSVGSFQVIPDSKQAATPVPLDDYLAQLTVDKANDRTHNDRRVRAQTNSLASEVALSFRSYMNSKEAEGDDTIGLK